MITNKTKLIVLRGPSGSGKSTVAKQIRLYPPMPLVLIEQDYLRRIVLKEKEVAGGLNIELIRQTVLFALEHDRDVVMEGIFDAERYSEMFASILKDHPANNFFYYFDISFEETLRRHQSKPNKDEFGETEMRRWYKSRDLLACVNETIILETNTLEDTVQAITSGCGLIKKA